MEYQKVSDKLNLLDRIINDAKEARRKSEMNEMVPGDVKLLFAKKNSGKVIFDDDYSSMCKKHDGTSTTLLSLL